jgi:hypothetical protein
LILGLGAAMAIKKAVKFKGFFDRAEGSHKNPGQCPDMKKKINPSARKE